MSDEHDDPEALGNRQPQIQPEIETGVQVEIQIDDAYAPHVDAENLRAVAVAMLQTSAVDEAELTIVVTSDETMQQLNRDYRGIDASTDVLSFAAQERQDESQDKAQHENDLAQPPELTAALDRYLGDIIIAYPYTTQQAAHFGSTPAAELRLMVAHGVLHLLGDDHDTPEAEAAMWARQETVLAQFGDQGLSQRHYDSNE